MSCADSWSSLRGNGTRVPATSRPSARFAGWMAAAPSRSLVTLLLCTCRRWDRVTAKLIAAIEGWAC